MSPTPISPALTDEEWSEVFDNDGCPVFIFPEEEDGEREIDITIRKGDRHRFAAACLHEQPFGFTREMVHAIRQTASQWAGVSHPGVQNFIKLADQAADRIEALLPPETP